MRNFKHLGFVLVGIGVLMIGCTKKEKLDQKMRIHLPVVNLTLDPQKMEDAYSMAIASQIHRGLFRYDTGGEVLADLAESWTESKDHLAYRIKLKPAKFSDGSPITSRHVQMSFARMFRLGASMAADIDHISGSETFKKTLDLSTFGVKAPEPGIVEFILARPSAIFLKQLAVADCAILNLDDFKKDPDLSASGAFSGPYKVEKSLTDGEVTIEKWRKDTLDSSRPPVHVTYFMTNEKPVELALASKTDTLDHDRMEEVERSKLQSLGWSPTPTELSGEIFVVLNPKEIPEAARKILFASVSANDLVQAIQRDSYRPAFGLIPFGVPGALSEKDAKELSSVPALALKKSETIRLDFEEGSDLELKIAQFLKVQWGKFNIEVSFNPLPKAEKLKRMFAKTSQAMIGRKTVDYPDGFSVLGYFKGNYESNYFFVNDPVIDSALSEILQVFDPASREERYREIQKMILKHWTIIPLLFGSEASGFWSSKVRKIPAHPLGYHMLPVETIEMKEE